MIKRVMLLLVLAATAAFFFWNFVVEKKEETTEKLQPVAIASGVTGFEAQVANSLAAYLAMKDAFVKSDTAIVNQSAAAFGHSLHSLDFNQLQTDSSLVKLAGELNQEIVVAAGLILSAGNIEAKRAPFETVSNKMFDLLRIVQYKGSKVYQQYCPMAFDDKGATWLSADTEIMNPYFGKKMLHCGEIQDSLRFANP